MSFTLNLHFEKIVFQNRGISLDSFRKGSFCRNFSLKWLWYITKKEIYSFLFLGQGRFLFFFLFFGPGSPLISTLEMKALIIGKSHFCEDSTGKTFEALSFFKMWMTGQLMIWLFWQHAIVFVFSVQGLCISCFFAKLKWQSIFYSKLWFWFILFSLVRNCFRPLESSCLETSP